MAESKAKTQATAQKKEQENIKNIMSSGKNKQLAQTVLTKIKTQNKMREPTDKPIISSKYYVDMENKLIYIPTGKQIDGTDYTVRVGSSNIQAVNTNQNIKPQVINAYKLDSSGKLREKPIIISSEKLTPKNVEAVIPSIKLNVEQGQFQAQIPTQERIQEIIQQQIQQQKTKQKTIQIQIPKPIKRIQLPIFIPPKVPKKTEDKIYKSIKKIQSSGKKPKIIYSYTPTLSGLGKKATITKGMFTGFEVRGSVIRLKPIIVKKHKRRTLVNKNFVRRHRRRKAKLFKPRR
jgi:hypothetical protein